MSEIVGVVSLQKSSPPLWFDITGKPRPLRCLSVTCGWSCGAGLTVCMMRVLGRRVPSVSEVQLRFLWPRCMSYAPPIRLTMATASRADQ